MLGLGAGGVGAERSSARQWWLADRAGAAAGAEGKSPVGDEAAAGGEDFSGGEHFMDDEKKLTGAGAGA